MALDTFAAIDFETANNERTSVCSVGIVVVRNGVVADSFYSLIKPEPEYYTFWCQQVHGITIDDTRNAPVFPEVWKQVEPLIEGMPLVAHNKAFDENCLKAVFRCYQMDYPDYTFLCTLQKSKRVWPCGHHNLDIIAERCGYHLANHHHALADAEACAAIALKLFNHNNDPYYMEAKDKVLETMKQAGTPLNAGKVAELSGLDRKEVDKAMKQLKEEGAIVSPKRCYWEPK